MALLTHKALANYEEQQGILVHSAPCGIADEV
jgi:hypothetical protein